jgi:hypothetical protein
MPTWSAPNSSKHFEYGAWDDRSSESEEDLPPARSLGLDAGSDYRTDASSSSSSYDLATEWSTDVGYTSGSEAEIESDAESHPELDDLLLISPANSRADSPIRETEMDDIRDIESEVSLRSKIISSYA